MKALGKLVVGGVSSAANVYDAFRTHDESVPPYLFLLSTCRYKMPKANCLGCGASRQEYAATAQTKRLLLNDTGDRCVCTYPHLFTIISVLSIILLWTYITLFSQLLQ